MEVCFVDVESESTMRFFPPFDRHSGQLNIREDYPALFVCMSLARDRPRVLRDFRREKKQQAEAVHRIASSR